MKQKSWAATGCLSWTSVIRLCGAVVYLALFTENGWAGPVAYNQVTKTPPNPCRAEVAYYPPGMTNYGLFFVDTNNCTTPTFTLISGPTNGLLEYRSDLANGRFIPVPLQVPLTNHTVLYPQANASKNYNNKYWSYTCTNAAMSIVGNMDSFTWQMNTSNGISGVATCYLNVAANHVPTARTLYRACTPGVGSILAVDFYDADALRWNATSPCAQRWSAVVATSPTNGTLVEQGLFLTYTPHPGVTQGLDRFTYKVTDTVDESAPAQCVIQIRAPVSRAGNLVLLIVNDSLLATPLTNEINRLKSDLESEGYSARIKSWNHADSSASNLWVYLANTYASSTQWVAGAILLGDMPRATLALQPGGAQQYTDLPCWNMDYFQTIVSAVAPRHIWVSRICWPGATYGDEISMLRRALNANHAYRTGASRLPHKAFSYCTAKFSGLFTDTNTVTRMREVWPVADSRGGPPGSSKWFLPDRSDLRLLEGYDCVGADCLAVGGELFEQVSDAANTSILWGDGLLDLGGLYRLINQVRFHVYYSCDCGAYGGFANSTLFTRGGGGVLTVASSGTGLGSRAGEYMMAQCLLEDTYFRRLIKDGESLGAAAVQYYPFQSTYNDRTMFYGDLSLRAMPAAANEMPIIRSVTNQAQTGSSSNVVLFSIDAYDPDGSVTNVEWFLDGYDYGRVAPTFSGIATNVSHTYAIGVYTVRVEVTDNYQARAWRESVVTVTASTNSAFSFRAVALTNTVYLRWTDPLTCGLSNRNVHIRWDQDHYPSNTADGGAAYFGSNMFYEHTNLTVGQSYYYTIWVSTDGLIFTNPP